MINIPLKPDPYTLLPSVFDYFTNIIWQGNVKLLISLFHSTCLYHCIALHSLCLVFCPRNEWNVCIHFVILGRKPFELSIFLLRKSIINIIIIICIRKEGRKCINADPCRLPIRKQWDEMKAGRSALSSYASSNSDSDSTHFLVSRYIFHP